MKENLFFTFEFNFNWFKELMSPNVIKNNFDIFQKVKFYISIKKVKSFKFWSMLITKNI